MNRTFLLACLSSILSLSASNHVKAIEPHVVAIDSGTVEIHLVDSLSSPGPVDVAYRPQGHCAPELNIESHGARTVVEHVRSCHGHGRDEGTIITLSLRQGASYRVELHSGRVEVFALGGIQDVQRFVSQVAVGGIRGPGTPTTMAVRRKRVLGAHTELLNPQGSGQLEIQVRYGEVRIN